VTSVVPALGNTADNKASLPREHDRSLDLPTQAYGGDKAYDDTDIYERFGARALGHGHHLKRQRTSKKDDNKERWLRLLADPTYQARRKQRFRSSRPFGIAKSGHGFEHCRY